MVADQQALDLWQFFSKRITEPTSIHMSHSVVETAMVPMPRGSSGETEQVKTSLQSLGVH
jgi:hypothetical protein